MLEELNNFFKVQSATKTLNIIDNSYLMNSANEVLDPVDKAVFSSCVSLGATTLFLFIEVSLSDIEEELSNLNVKM